MASILQHYISYKKHTLQSPVKAPTNGFIFDVHQVNSPLTQSGSAETHAVFLPHQEWPFLCSQGQQPTSLRKREHSQNLKDHKEPDCVFQLDTITIGLRTKEESRPSDSSPCCDYACDLSYTNQFTCVGPFLKLSFSMQQMPCAM